MAMSAFVVGSTGSVAAQPGGFSDVPEDAYYSVPVEALARRGIFRGTECAHGFCPAALIDRKTMAVWTVRVLDGQDPSPITESRFDDVDAVSFYAPFIERMAELGVTTGCGDRSGFCPDRVVTRAQTAVFISRAYKLPDGPDPGFTDVSDDAWYKREVAKLAASRITGGCGDGTAFCPSRQTTRREMATFLYRAENRELLTGTDGRKTLDAGSSHTCVLQGGGSIACWGSNSAGQSDPPEGTYKFVTSGGEHSCALQEGGSITCWGSNSAGQSDVPAGSYTAVAAGSEHSCGLRADSTVICWGTNLDGESDAPWRAFTAISAGLLSCGLRPNGAISCWGSNNHGQQTDRPFRTDFVAVSVGFWHSCGLQADGRVRCWGLNSFGQASPPFRSRFIAVSAGGLHTCGLLTDGTVECWGSDSDLTGNVIGQSNAPSGTFVAVSAGWMHSCGLRIDGSIECWGSNSHGQTDPPSGT